MPMRMMVVLLLYAPLLAAADLPGDAAILQLKERGAGAAEDLSRAYGVNGFATDPFHKDESLLCLAVQSGNMKAVKWLLDHGAHVEGHDGRGMPLWFAAFRKDVSLVRLLLSRGAKPKAVQGRVPMLEPVVRSDQVELARLLIDNGAPVDYTLVLLSCTDAPVAMTQYLVSKVEMTAYWMTRCMDFALEKDKFETAHFFLSGKKVPVSEQTVFIALASAILRKPAISNEMLREIISRAPNINALDTTTFHYFPGELDGFSFEDKTALMIAAYYNRTDIMQLLIEAQASLNAQVPGRKYTALHYAAIRCRKEAIDLLLSRGASPNLNDIFERAPLNYADESCPGDIVGRLARAGARKTILTRSTKRDIRNYLLWYGVPIAYTVFAVAMREGVYKDNPQDNAFGRVNGVLATTFLLGPLPAFVLVQSKTLGLLGAIIAPYLAVVGGIAGLTLGLVYNERFNDNRAIYYASVAPIYSFTLAQFFF